MVRAVPRLSFCAFMVCYGMIFTFIYIYIYIKYARRSKILVGRKLYVQSSRETNRTQRFAGTEADTDSLNVVTI
jgi:preprotein translocase subunit SecY